VGIDIDGVIRNIFDPLISYWEDMHDGQVMPMSKWTDVNLHKYFNCKREELDKFWHHNYAEEIYNFSAYPYPKAVTALQKIAKLHDIILLSAQMSRKSIAATVDWLHKYNIPYKELHFTNYYEGKGAVDCNVYTDDSPIQYEKILEYNKNSRVWLIDRPWNQLVKTFWRFKNLEEVYRELKKRFQ
jgi:uncharacterized HAD superfamily protein